MREIHAATFVTLDGIMQAPGGPDEDPAGGFAFGGWSVPYFDEAVGQAIGEAFAEPFDLLLGRKTYEIFAAHWPHLPDDPMAQTLNAATKYVATRSDLELGWVNSVALRGDAVGQIADLKAGEGPKLLIQGSSRLIQDLLAHHLIDRFTLIVSPVVVGQGKRLFGSGAKPMALDLVSSRVSATGVTIATYRRTGEVRTGSFALPEPTQDEVRRRERLSAEG